MHDPPSAQSLAEALAAGDRQAFAALYDRLGRKMLRVAAGMLGRIDAAEDVVHDVFINLARRRECLRGVLDLDAYVFVMLRHAISAKRTAGQRERQHLRQLAQMRGEAVSPADDPTNDEVGLALAALPAEQREVVVLKIDGALTFAQIAEVLDISPNTAASRYRYALEKLRQMIGDEP